jgi:hypothetical protein
MRAGGSKDHTIIADAYSDPDADSDSDPDANPYSDPDADSDSDPDADPDTDANTYSDHDTDANTYSDPDANADVAHLGLHGRMVIDERGLGGNGFDLHGSRCRQPAIDVLLDTCG